ncbi:Transporter, putative [Neisseria gonorrhoeae]|uniref:Transporter, putative n=1 Tax=Neisseria gonorrhoeae TaxID=485 RepID=A0A378VYA5_NEIGO|nr:Transporter, putative [Neisseria gonorrhoeae]
MLLALLLIIVPMLVGQFNNLASRLPQLIGFMQNTLLPWLKIQSADMWKSIRHLLLRGFRRIRAS